jgi:hypothetical protein
MPALTSTMQKRRFYKQTFQVKDKGKEKYRHTMLINPQEMTIAEPARINTQQTLGGAYVSHFGQGLFQVTLSGVTGYKARYNADGQLRDGYEEFKAFRDKVYRDFVTYPSSQLELFWYNWEDEQYFKIVPTSFRLMRSKSEAIMYRYELAFVCLNTVGAGTKPIYNANKLDEINLALIGQSMASTISGTSEAMLKIGGN